jgi:hypothetical protein
MKKQKVALAIVLSLALIISIVLIVVLAPRFSNTPKDNLTRGQMAAIVTRAFGTTEKVSLSSYTDVEAGAGYYDDMAKAVQMKILVGTGDKLYPNANITREEAFVALACAFKLSGAPESALQTKLW